MSLVDKSEDYSEPVEFARSFDPDSARRQLRMSLVLVAAMAVAAFILGFALPLNAPHSARETAVISDSGAFSGRLVTIDDNR